MCQGVSLDGQGGTRKGAKAERERAQKHSDKGKGKGRNDIGRTGKGRNRKGRKGAPPRVKKTGAGLLGCVAICCA